MPLISVIVPVYKVEKFIEQCIRSVINQSFRDFELILVDDCTPDDSMAIACRIASEATDITTIKLKTPNNSGLSVARNLGIEASSSPYFFLIDSDDYIADNCLELFASAASKYPEAEIIYGSSQIFGLMNHFDSLEIYKKNLPDYISEQRQAKSCMLTCDLLPTSVWNRLYKTDWWRDNKLSFKEGILAQDFHLNFYMARCVTKIAIVKGTTYFYRAHKSNVSFSKRAHQLNCADWAVRDWFFHMDKRNILHEFPYILHKAHSSYVSRRGDKKLQSVLIRYPAAFLFFLKIIFSYKSQPPVETKPIQS